ncbi:MAG: hypothetical protein ACI841_004499 [Planctomycetota bacterium]|jgi:hypothetical protein
MRLLFRATLFFIASTLLIASGHAAQDWRSYSISETDQAAATSIQWERSLDDALAISKETGRPLLIAVCVDGESASEVFANKLYKDAEYIELMRGFVPIVLSYDRHTDSDHDESGRRVICPKFGSVTCGEHAADELVAYRRWFGGVRYSPRHIGVAPDGETILFDRYLDQDLANVRRALKRHGVRHGALAARMDRLDSASRTTMERDYVAGSPSFRVTVLREIPRSQVEHEAILRMALASVDPNEKYYATLALAQCGGPKCVDLMAKLLFEQRGASFTSELEQRLARLAKSDQGAKKAWRVLQALDKTGELATDLNVPAWTKVLRSARQASIQSAGEDEILARLETISSALDAQPDDATLMLELAEETLRLARAKLARGASPGFLFQDARDGARRARLAGAFPEEVAIVDTQAAYMTGEREVAIVLALDALPALRNTRTATSERAARVLEVLARARTQQIYEAESGLEDWPASWLAEAHAAYTILAQHPAGKEAEAIAHADLLSHLKGHRWLNDLFDRAVARWPRSADLHARLRNHVGQSSGLLALESNYDQRASAATDPAAFSWFHGYASMMTAEAQIRSEDFLAARETYTRAIARFEHSSSLEPAFASTAASYAALAEVGQARLYWDEQVEQATDLVMRAFIRSPTCGEWRDGFGNTPIDALGLLRVKIRKSGQKELLETLRSGIAESAPGAWAESDRLPGSFSAGGPSR